MALTGSLALLSLLREKRKIMQPVSGIAGPEFAGQFPDGVSHGCRSQRSSSAPGRAPIHLVQAVNIHNPALEFSTAFQWRCCLWLFLYHPCLSEPAAALDTLPIPCRWIVPLIRIHYLWFAMLSDGFLQNRKRGSSLQAVGYSPPGCRPAYYIPAVDIDDSR